MLRRAFIATGCALLALILIDRASLFLPPCFAEFTTYKSSHEESKHDDYCTERKGIIVAGVKTLYSLPPEIWTALATIAIAGFTATLWWATIGHGGHMKESVETARLAAEAAFAVETGRLFIGSIHLNVARGPGNSKILNATAEVVFKNLGRTPAILIASAAELALCPILPERPNFNKSYGDINYGEVVLSAGDHWNRKAYFPRNLTTDQWDDVANGRNYIWFYGVVAYWDIAHCENRYYFCARWFPNVGGGFGPHAGHFVQWQVDNYSYYYRNPDPADASRVAPIRTAVPRTKDDT
jgi:hypothetical protein